MSALDVVLATRVVPVVEIDDAADAIPLAETLVDAGLAVIEVTLRTPAALAAIRAIAVSVPAMTLGAGTVLTGRDAEAAAAAGAAFLVAPGRTDALSTASARLGVPLVPGAVTASEVLAARDAGHRILKFFPAELSGGLAMLRALHGPLAHTGIRFMPTGGIRPDTLPAYLAEPAVAAVGGTWIAPRALIAAREFDRIADAARSAAAAVRAGLHEAVPAR